jgi:hypothetical protein
MSAAIELTSGDVVISLETGIREVALGNAQVGTPAAGTYDGGYTPIATNTTIADAIDALNKSLATVAADVDGATVGLPLDGAWTGGYASISASDSVATALDKLNTAVVALTVSGNGTLGTPTTGGWSGYLAGVTNATPVKDAIQTLGIALATVQAGASVSGAGTLGAPPTGTWGTGYVTTLSSAATVATAIHALDAGLAAVSAVAQAPGQRPIGVPSSGTWATGYAAIASTDTITNAIATLNVAVKTVSQALSQAALGTPTDGVWSGYSAIGTTTKVVDAIDILNTALGTVNTAVSTAQAAANAAQSTANTALTGATSASQAVVGTPTDGSWVGGYSVITGSTKIVDALDAINTGLAAVSAAANAAQSTANTPGQQALGTPTDGSFSAGYLSLNAGTKVVDAIDLINDALVTGIVGASTAQSAATAAQTTANAAVTAAGAAQAAADAAQTTANAPAQRTVGTPSDGSWLSGYVAITSASKIVDALDLINEGLATTYSLAGTAQTAASSAQTTASTALTNAATAQTTANAPGQQAQGSPTSGGWTGYLPLSNATKIVDSIQAINAAMSGFITGSGGTVASLAITSLTATTLGVSGLSSLASATLSGTLGVTGLATLASLSVTGTTDLAAMTATTGAYSGLLTANAGATVAAGKQVFFGTDATGSATAAQGILIGGVDPQTYANAGAQTYAFGYQAIAIGSGAIVKSTGSADNNLAIGTQTLIQSVNGGASAGSSFRNSVVGFNAGAQGYRNLSLGNGANCSGTYNVAVGDYAACGDLYGTALVQVQRGTAIGKSASVQHDYSTAIGQAAVTTATRQIMLGTSLETVVHPGASTFAGAISGANASFSGTLGVTGAATLSSTLGVAGSTTLAAVSATNGAFSGTLGVTGNTTLGGTLGVTGSTTLAAISATTLTLSGTLSGATVTGTSFVIVGKSQIQSAADGYLQLLNNAATGFTGLRFGGASASFPMFKVSGTGFLARLADDSADTSLGVASLTASSAVNAVTGNFSGAVTGASYSGGAISGTTGTFSGALSVSGNISGWAQALAPNGGATTPSYSFANSPTTGMYSSATNTLDLSTAGVVRLSIAANGTMTSSYTLTVSNAVQSNAFRAQTSTATANFDNFQFTSQNITAAATTLTQGGTSRLVSNIGAAAQTVITLPAGALGLFFVFENDVSFGMQIKAPSGVTISLPSGASSAGGTQTTTTVNGTLFLMAISSTKWVAVGTPSGTWTAA